MDHAARANGNKARSARADSIEMRAGSRITQNPLHVRRKDHDTRRFRSTDDSHVKALIRFAPFAIGLLDGVVDALIKLAVHITSIGGPRPKPPGEGAEYATNQKTFRHRELLVCRPFGNRHV